MKTYAVKNNYTNKEFVVNARSKDEVESILLDKFNIKDDTTVKFKIKKLNRDKLGVVWEVIV